jgi:hypothetical protein
VILIRLLLLAIVVNSFAPAPVARAAASAPAVDLANTGAGELDSPCCVGCVADPEGAARPLSHVLPNLACGDKFAAISDPFTEEHLRLPFRPPMAG